MQGMRRWRRTAPAVCLIFLTLLTVRNAEYAANGIKKGLFLFGNMLLPSLLPFLVLSELFFKSGAGAWLGKLLSRPLRALFGLTENGASALLLGWLCGVPVGAAYAVRLYRKGAITKDELQRLMLLANTPSTGFLLGGIGLSLFGSKEIGIALLVATLAATGITGIAFKLLKGKLTPAPLSLTEDRTSESPAASFTGAVKSSANTLLTVGAFVLFFAAVSECVRTAATALSLSDLFTTLSIGVLELSAGVSAATTAHTPEAALLLCAFFAGFAGLSIALQVFTVTEGEGVRLCPYLVIKAVQGLLAAGLTGLYLVCKKPSLSCVAQGFSEMSHILYRVPLLTYRTVLIVLPILLLLPPLLHYRTVRFYKIK